jgi:broad specificity phosphatase PhoE
VSVRIIYETHATTTDNEAGVATGWLPGELSAAGREQAAELGLRRADSPAAAVYVSDLRRATQTADIAFAGRPVPIVVDARLRECNYGTLNGMPVERLRAERRKRIQTRFPGGESYMHVVARTADFLADLLAARDGQSVVLISHSANRWALQHLVHGIPLEDLIDADFDWQPGWEYVLTSADSPGVPDAN